MTTTLGICIIIYCLSAVIADMRIVSSIGIIRALNPESNDEELEDIIFYMRCVAYIPIVNTCLLGRWLLSYLGAGR